MRIQEAIKSGKRFRRAGWIESGKVNPDYWTYASRGSFTLLTEDLLAEDWEVKPVSIAVTEAEFDAAWDKASSINSAGQWLASFKGTLKKELGL